jgi:NAD(P)-dependent dehydrogenase (short-subunit alcohol dehydrogenase family)
MAISQGSLSLPAESYSFPKVFFKHQIRPNAKPSLDLGSAAGATAIITGANAGIGLESAKILLSLNISHLVLAVRTLTKGEEAAAPLRVAFPQTKIEVWHLDMNSYDSINAFVRQCATLDRLDIAILSAGIMNIDLRVNASTGHEEMFQVNYLSTALLAVSLLPLLKRREPSDSPGRLTLVASGAALIADFSSRDDAAQVLKSFDQTSGWNSSLAKTQYDASKGLVLMLTLKLSELVAAEEVVVNVVDPSFTPGTSFFRELPFAMRILLRPLTALLGTTVNNAAWRYVDAAVSRGGESHGSFISDWVVHP